MAEGEQGAEIKVNLSEDEDIYRLMDILRGVDGVIDEISHEEIDMEKVYLEVVRKERSFQ